MLVAAQPPSSSAGRVCIGFSEGPASPIVLLRHDVHLPDDDESSARCRDRAAPAPPGPLLPVARRVRGQGRAARLAAGRPLRRDRARPRRGPGGHRPAVAGPRGRPLGRRPRHVTHSADSRPTVLFVSVPTGDRRVDAVAGQRPVATLDGRRRADPGRAGPGPLRRAGRPTSGSAETATADRLHRPRFRPLRRAWSVGAASPCSLWRHRRRLTAIHANGLKELSLALPAAFLGRVRLVVWVHNFLLPPSVKLLGGVWRRLLPRMRRPLGRGVAAGPRPRGRAPGWWPRRRRRDRPQPDRPGRRLAPDPARAGRRTRSPSAYLGAPREYKGFQFLPDHRRGRTRPAPTAGALAGVLPPDRRRPGPDMGPAAGDGGRTGRACRSRASSPTSARPTSAATSWSARRCSTRSAGWRPRPCSTACPWWAATCRRSATCSGTTRPACSSRSGDVEAAAKAVVRAGRRPRPPRAAWARPAGRRGRRVRPPTAVRRPLLELYGHRAGPRGPRGEARRQPGGRARRPASRVPSRARRQAGRRLPAPARPRRRRGGWPPARSRTRSAGRRRPPRTAARSAAAMSVRHDRVPGDSGSASRAWRGLAVHLGRARRRPARRTAACGRVECRGRGTRRARRPCGSGSVDEILVAHLAGSGPVRGRVRRPGRRRPWWLQLMASVDRVWRCRRWPWSDSATSRPSRTMWTNRASGNRPASSGMRRT